MVECVHKSVERCHYTYTTQFEPHVQEVIMTMVIMIMAMMIMVMMIMVMMIVVPLHLHHPVRAPCSRGDYDHDIYIMMKCLSVCLSVTKNDHFLLGVSCNHLNPP